MSDPYRHAVDAQFRGCPGIWDVLFTEAREQARRRRFRAVEFVRVGSRDRESARAGELIQIGALLDLGRSALASSGLHRAWGVLFPARSNFLTREPDRLPDGRWIARYETLDIWRALVAIGIVLHHAGRIDFGVNTGRVVLFFVISGYCIAASAESCLRRGMTGWAFFSRRARRIYPPYLLALLFWIGTRLIKLYRTGENDLLYSLDQQPRSIWDWIHNLTITQWMAAVNNPVPRPGAIPGLFVAAYWSLGYEEQFYLVVSIMFAVAIAVPWARFRWMIPALVPFAIAYGLAFPQTIRGIFIEFWTAFAVGAITYYRLSVFSDRRWRVGIEVALAILVAFSLGGLAFDDRIGHDIDRSKWEEWLIAGVFGLVLIALRPLDRRIVRSRLVVPLRAVGRISYSLFLIHQFNLTLISTISAKVIRFVSPGYAAPVYPALYPWYDITLQIILHIMLATVFWFFCEYPFLSRSDEGRRQAPPAREGLTASASGTAIPARAQSEAAASHAG